MLRHLRYLFRQPQWGVIPLLCFLLLSGCEEELSIPDGAFDEHIIDIQGSWKISRVLLNNADVTDRFDFSGFELVLNMGTNGPTDYQINSASAPFVILENGSWAFDDPVYPTSMTFSSPFESASISLADPPISKDTKLNINFTLGCQDNIYRYELRKQTN